MSYDYYEPTEEEQLDTAVYDDASDPDSNELMHRQNERWEQFLADRKMRADRVDKDLKAALHGRGWKVPTWWELWQPPLLGEAEQAVHRWIMQGNLHYETRLETQDVYAGGGMPLRVLPVAYHQYLDFYPIMDQHLRDLPRLDLLPRLTQGKTQLTSNDFVGDWGWWDQNKHRFRSRAWGAREIRDEQGDQVSVAVLIKEPPPYGNWMPVLDLNRGIVGLP